MKSFIVTFVTTVFIFSLLTAPCYAGQLDLFKQPCSSVSKWPKIPMPAMQHVVTGVTGIGAAGIAFDGWKNEKQRVKLMVSGVAGGAISALVAHHLLKCDLLPSVTSGVMAGLLLHRVLAKQEVQKDQDGAVEDSKKQEEVIDEENGQEERKWVVKNSIRKKKVVVTLFQLDSQKQLLKKDCAVELEFPPNYNDYDQVKEASFASDAVFVRHNKIFLDVKVPQQDASKEMVYIYNGNDINVNSGVCLILVEDNQDFKILLLDKDSGEEHGLEKTSEANYHLSELII